MPVTIELGNYIQVVSPRYRVLERVRFLHMSKEMLAARASNESLHEVTEQKTWEEALLDLNLLRCYHGRSVVYYDPLDKKTPANQELARKAVRHLQTFLHFHLNAQQMTFPLNAILADPRIAPFAIASCYMHLLRCYWSDVALALQGKPANCFKWGNDFLSKYYALTRDYPEIFKQENIPWPDDFSEGAGNLSNPFGTAGPLALTGCDLPLYFRMEGFSYWPVISPKWPSNEFWNNLQWDRFDLRNLVFYEDPPSDGPIDQPAGRRQPKSPRLSLFL